MKGWKTWHGDKLIKLTSSSVSHAMLDAAHVVGEQADTQVPHDEGYLQRSKIIKVDPTNPEIVKIGYGGGPGTGHPEVPYALRWHETQANFQKGRKWKYLINPLKTVGPRALMRSLKQRLSRTWR